MNSNIFYMNDLFDTKILASLSDAEGKVYAAYLRYSNGGKDQCYPSQDRLAENMGLARRTVGRAIKRLKTMGYIRQISSGKGGNSTKSNVFTVKTPSQLGFTVDKSQNSLSNISTTLSNTGSLIQSTPNDAQASSSIFESGTEFAKEVYELGLAKGNRFISQFKRLEDFIAYVQKTSKRNDCSNLSLLNSYKSDVDSTDPGWCP